MPRNRTIFRVRSRKAAYFDVGPDVMFQSAVKRMYSAVNPDDVILRLHGIEVLPEFRGKGFGKKLFRKLFELHPDIWIGSSQLGLGTDKQSAINALESVPGIEVHWDRFKGGHFIARKKTDELQRH